MTKVWTIATQRAGAGKPASCSSLHISCGLLALGYNVGLYRKAKPPMLGRRNGTYLIVMPKRFADRWVQMLVPELRIASTITRNGFQRNSDFVLLVARAIKSALGIVGEQGLHIDKGGLF